MQIRLDQKHKNGRGKPREQQADAPAPQAYDEKVQPPTGEQGEGEEQNNGDDGRDGAIRQTESLEEGIRKAALARKITRLPRPLRDFVFHIGTFSFFFSALSAVLLAWHSDNFFTTLILSYFAGLGLASMVLPSAAREARAGALLSRHMAEICTPVRFALLAVLAAFHFQPSSLAFTGPLQNLAALTGLASGLADVATAYRFWKLPTEGEQA